ncbi:N-acetyl-gamma-glutamyl-phosphate reductase [Pedobacter zeae]|uniref:N-acetyl-gamma-glutamyl-phosphate reductase n=1 Tax=Pedobacter zeae TaxID=1737356 RepID=A0A7W6P7B3_9SPHI|nr:N-acetyl-gamma-glutamyl-phosphate reductase [Pedobacter zeae]MBB4110017.1 N-acetyl-gamma-glutamyl-phosphate reductase [Pedobacter zeae]GGH15551.1 N-acetyl-gamma-glutamyl-phosphate reductase [Pedobacter zeae]
MNKIKAGIIGGAGYTGGEMLRILINHPNVEIAFVNSTSNAGNLISDVHTDLVGDTDLKFVSNIEQDIDVLFLCVGHGDAKKFLAENPVSETIKIIDLSQDFRLHQKSTFENREFVYGLPELNRDKIKTAKNIANPGCFATCIQLGLLPLAEKGLIRKEVHINATTGSTGAGQSLAATSHFSWRNNNLSVYKAFEHQHLNEISESLLQLQPSLSEVLNFIPQRGAFTRGILAAMYLETDLTLEEAQNIYEEYYSAHPFTHVSRKNIDLKQVVNTNKALVHVEKHGGKLFIISIIDNLLKGASGQAVQNMNIMFGLEETAGLRLKAANF